MMTCLSYEPIEGLALEIDVTVEDGIVLDWTVITKNRNWTEVLDTESLFVAAPDQEDVHHPKYETLTKHLSRWVHENIPLDAYREPNYPDDSYDDGQALASAGWGTDENYGG
jgi:hypothetical protein